MFYHSNPWVFLIIDLNQHSFYGLNTRETNFFWFESFFEYWFKNCHGSFVEKLLSVWRIISGCQTQPDLPNLPRWLKSHIAFSMFPICTWYKSLFRIWIQGTRPLVKHWGWIEWIQANHYVSSELSSKNRKG